jgi:hypothetical protein
MGGGISQDWQFVDFDVVLLVCSYVSQSIAFTFALVMNASRVLRVLISSIVLSGAMLLLPSDLHEMSHRAKMFEPCSQAFSVSIRCNLRQAKKCGGQEKIFTEWKISNSHHFQGHERTHRCHGRFLRKGQSPLTMLVDQRMEKYDRML